MKLLDKTFASPAENLAIDEALLEHCDKTENETLRFWEAKHYFVVLGYSCHHQVEVCLDYCNKQSVPVLRRISGGGTILQGPGCLNYSLILQIKNRPRLKNIVSTNKYIMDAHSAILEKLLNKEVKVLGDTDLTVQNLKFSGNAQRRSMNSVLFHGTFLCDFDLQILDKILANPKKQPAYRNLRSHADFLTNIDLDQEKIRKAFIQFWQASTKLEKSPLQRMDELVKEKYSKPEWNFKF